MGYKINITDEINILPYTGLGIFYERLNGYLTVYASQNYGYASVPVKESYTASMANFGFLLQYYISPRIFIQGGAKYQLDIYDGRYTNFPNLSLGVGYAF